MVAQKKTWYNGSEFKSSLVYLMSPRIARTMWRGLVSIKDEKEEEEERKH